MGMAAPQARLLQLTSRKNTIGRNLQDLSLQKMSLSRDMAKVTRNYQNALNSKMFKWSNNAGVSYVDLSYSTLMKPNAANQNVPYLLTNTNGQVVVDSKYEKYAQMIEANGGKYEGDTRLKILSGLTGISKDTLSNAECTSAGKTASENNINELQKEVDKLDEKAKNSRTKEADFIKLFGNTSLGRMGGDAGLGTSIYNWYSNIDSNGNTKMCWSLDTDATKSKAMIKEFLEGIGNTMQRYLGDSDLEKFNKAIETVTANYNNYIDIANPGNCGDTCQVSLDNSGDANGYYVLNPYLIIQELLRAYDNSTSSTNGANTYYNTYDRESDAYKNYEAKKNELENAKAEYKAIVNADNQTLNVDQESKIKFYDQLFTAIAEKGWECNYQVEDGSYLNEMLQNNQYFITTMKSAEDEDGKSYYEYDDSIASNMNNIVIVNDSDAQQEAQVEYEYQKSKISEKETHIDTRMQDLETEQSAINNMIKGLETVRNDNIERTMGIFA